MYQQRFIINYITMQKLLFIFSIGLLFTSCASKKKQAIVKADPIERVYELLQGHYTFNNPINKENKIIGQELHIVPIWQDSTDEKWLYVEESESSKNPNRQRVYRLEQSVDYLKAIVYSIPKEKDYVNAWKEEFPLSDINPFSLRQEKGCTIFFKEIKPDEFRGLTLSNNCSTRFMGAKYSTATIMVSKDGFYKLEQGFDQHKRTLWGPKEGGIPYERK